MASYHKVEQGECLSSIAQQYGFTDYHTIYDHPRNALLKQQRPNPNVLLPGDCLFIPDKQDKQEQRSTTQQHTFCIQDPTCLLRMRLLDEEEKPYAGKRYVLKVDGRIYTGCTSGEGVLEQEVPVQTRQAELMLWPDPEDEEEILHSDLALGYLNPAEEVSGVQARLNNLGFSCGSVDGIAGPKTEQALKRFQRKAGLTPTGKIDSQTQNLLRQWHDAMTEQAA